MVKRALIEHRPWLLLSVVAAIAFYFLHDNPIGGVWLMLLKGTGVGLLAVYALRRTRGLIGPDGLILALVMALSSAADMALEINFVAGGALFAASHLAAIALYMRNRRDRTVWSQRMLALGLVIVVPLVSYFLSGQVEVAIYAITLGLMAAAAWTSRFPRYRVGIGAVLFVISDWLIFSRMGSVDLGVLPDLLVWPLYYAGQLMIATGVVQTLLWDAGQGARPER